MSNLAIFCQLKTQSYHIYMYFFLIVFVCGTFYMPVFYWLLFSKWAIKNLKSLKFCNMLNVFPCTSHNNDGYATIMPPFYSFVCVCGEWAGRMKGSVWCGNHFQVHLRSSPFMGAAIRPMRLFAYCNYLWENINVVLGLGGPHSIVQVLTNGPLAIGGSGPIYS